MNGAGEPQRLSDALDLDALREITLDAVKALPGALKSLPGQVARKDAGAIQTTILLALYYAVTSTEIDPGREQLRKERLAPIRRELFQVAREVRAMKQHGRGGR